MRLFIMTIVLSLFASVAVSKPKAEKGTGKLCTGYAEVYEGVWLDQSGKDTLLWRVGRTGKKGCYAWLNSVPAWDVKSAGVRKSKIKKNGTKLIFEWRGEKEKLVISGDGTAKFFIGEYLTQGRYSQIK